MKQLRRSSFFLAFTLVMAWGAAVPAAATSYVRMSDEDLLDRSPVVVEGRIVAVEAVDARVPAVEYRVEVLRRIKGPLLASDLAVRVPGGVRSDGVGLKIWGAPRFALGEEALLFLTPRRDGTHALHQFMLGAFHIADVAGRRLALRYLEGTVEVSPAGLPVAEAKNRDGARDLAAFRRWMKNRLDGHLEPADGTPDYRLTDPEIAELTAGDSKFTLITSSSEPPPLGCGMSGGRPVRWSDSRTPWPVPWRFHVDGQEGLPADGLSDFRAALQSWADDPHTPVRYLYIGRTEVKNGFLRRDNINAVIFEDPNDEIGGSFIDSGVLAIGGPWFLCDIDQDAGKEFHPIVEADIIIQDGVKVFFDAARDAPAAARELFAHELGHTLGLAHSPSRDALMNATIHADGRGASHSVDDLAAAYHLYGDPTGGEELTRPQAPSDLAARVSEYTRIVLEWTDNSSQESHFLIERRRLGELNFRFVATVPTGRRRYIDQVDAQSTHTYRVMAQNAAGRSLPTALARVETPEDPRPLAPSGLRTATISNSRIQLSWQDNADNEERFAVQVLRGVKWIEFSTALSPNRTRALVMGLASGQSFTFRVLARNDFGQSEPSNEASSTTFVADSSCVSKDSRLCLEQGRFTVDIEYQDPVTGLDRPATVEPLTDQASLVWFFVRSNPELLIRAQDLLEGEATRISVSSLSDVGYRITVTDTLTGEVRRHVKQAGQVCDGMATEWALPGPKGTAGTSCQPDTETLCVFAGRFTARLTWWDPTEPDVPRPAQVVVWPTDNGLFSFGPPNHPDVVFKMLDGRGINNHFWVFASRPFNSFPYELSVLDTFSGESKIYRHDPGVDCAVVDTAAFR